MTLARSGSRTEMARSVSVPFLPGYSVPGEKQRASNRRPQTLVRKLGGQIEYNHEAPVDLAQETLDALRNPAPLASAASGLLRSASSGALQKQPYRPEIQPAWLKHDRQALRFFAYFQEAVTESATENVRVRNVLMTYFLEDGTMQITEPKVENSGIWPQGPFVKRHRIPKGDGLWTIQDLRLGMDCTIYARTFRIIDCDEFTKWFFEQAGMDIGVAEEAPLDNFFETQVWKKESMMKNTGWPADVMKGKEYNEIKLGGGRRNDKLKQFLENDRKVLRFYAYWDDPTKYGARMYFTIHYFLCDDTVEINNMYMRNTGKWETPVFFKRQPLKLRPSTNVAPGMIEAPSPLLTPADFEIGKMIPVYGRDLFVYDFDEATQKFYKEYMGKDMVKIEIPEPAYVTTRLRPPPHTIYGSEEDSLGSCLQVTMRKPPHRDLVKLMVNSDRILRYEGVPENKVPEDAHRKFIIAIFMADDTVAVYEVKQRNSGCLEGKFMERSTASMPAINPENGERYRPGDFFVGTQVILRALQLRITRADEYTLKYMETDPQEFPQSSIQIVASKLAGLAKRKEELPATVQPEDLRDIVQALLGFDLSDQELITVLRSCAVPDTAEVDLEALYAIIEEQ